LGALPLKSWEKFGRGRVHAAKEIGSHISSESMQIMNELGKILGSYFIIDHDTTGSFQSLPNSSFV
jgi:hypothetical protein